MSTDPADPDRHRVDPGAGTDQEPAPRRTRDGRVLLGPSVRARYLPGLLIGLPLLSLLLSPLGAIAIEQILRGRASSGGLLHLLRSEAWAQLLAGFLLLWLVLGLWALVPLLLTRSLVLLDLERGTLERRRGLRRHGPRIEVTEVLWAVGGPERGDAARIGHRPDPVAGSAGGPVTEWIVPDIGWDSASYDGLRSLQRAAGLEPSPSRSRQREEARRLRRAGAHREAADRVGMPWRPEYEHDPEAFLLEYDRVRRVLTGHEEPRDGDPVRVRRRQMPHP